MSNNTRRRGLNPVLAFILGFLFGIIFLIGSVVGAVFIALNYKIDKVGANKDENGNYIFINADPENGGAATVLELIKKVAAMAGSPSTLTLGEIENLLPVTVKLTDGIYGALEKYVTIDRDEINSLEFSALGGYFKDRVMEIRPAAILDGFGGSLADNKIIDILVNGKEADYVETDGARYPVYYDVYELREGTYVRTADGAALGAGKEEYLEERDGEYRLYFFKAEAARSAELCYITVKADGKFAFDTSDEYLYAFSESTAKLTGSYYYDGEEKVEVNPVTLGSFTDGSAFSAFDEVPVTDFVDSEDELTSKILGDVTVGDLINGNVNFEEIVNGIEISSFMDVTPEDKIVAFLVFSITEIEEREGVYTAVYHPEEGEPEPCTLTVEDGNIKDVVLESGEKTEHTGINEVSSQVSRLTKTLKLKDVITIDESDKVMSKLGEYVIDEVGNAVDELTLDDFMEVSLTHDQSGKLSLDTADVVLAYVVYGISDITEKDGIITGVYNSLEEGKPKFACNIVCENEKIIRAYYLDGGEEVEIAGTTVNTVSDRVGGVTSDLRIGQLMDVTGNKLLESIKNSTIESLPSDIDSLSINELYAEDIYSKKDADGNVIKAELKHYETYNDAYLYYEQTDDGYKLVRDMTAEKFALTPEKYLSYGEPNGTWKLLLCKNGKEQPYSVNNLTELMNNVTANTQVTTLRELTAAGMLDLDENKLNTPFGDKTVGDLTLMTAINEFINALNRVGI